MIGYVLWSDTTVGKAIIWCEDQGDLAYYTGQSDLSEAVVRKGDWIRFDLTVVGNTRLAANACVLEKHCDPRLAERLVAKALESSRAASRDEYVAPRRGNVIPFPAQPRKRKAALCG